MENTTIVINPAELGRPVVTRSPSLMFKKGLFMLGKKSPFWFTTNIAGYNTRNRSELKADIKGALPWLLHAAYRGHAEAQYTLWRLYKGGNQVISRENAFKWLFSAKRSGYPVAEREFRELPELTQDAVTLQNTHWYY